MFMIRFLLRRCYDVMMLPIQFGISSDHTLWSCCVAEVDYDAYVEDDDDADKIKDHAHEHDYIAMC